MTDQSDAGSTGIFSWRTNQIKSYYRLFVAPRCMLMADQSDAGSVGIFSWRTRTVEIHHGWYTGVTGFRRKWVQA
eukprot:1380901-Pyramimonas_sp.AAC.1